MSVDDGDLTGSGGTSPADPNPAGATLAPLGEPSTIVSSAGAVAGQGSPNSTWASDQPAWPTVWPPTTPPPPQTNAGVVPWKMWLGRLATRPYLTDPPPCPVVVSYYGWPPNLQY